jgi:hypothetical protein
MRKVRNLLRFERADNPSREALHAIDPNLTILPSYTGVNTNPDLARLFVNRLKETQQSVNELSKFSVPMESSATDTPRLFTIFVAHALRLGIPDAGSVFYTLSASVPMQTDDKLFYILALSKHFSGNIVGVASTLKQLLTTDTPRDENGNIPIESLDKFYILNAALRSEGVILPVKEVFLYSCRWGEKDVIELLFKGLDLREATRMYDIGFTTLEDIVAFYGKLPENWIDALLE